MTYIKWLGCLCIACHNIIIIYNRHISSHAHTFDFMKLQFLINCSSTIYINEPSIKGLLRTGGPLGLLLDWAATG